MKKMKFTKNVALILLFACMFTLFAGCSTPATPTEPAVNENVTWFYAEQFASIGGMVGVRWKNPLTVKVDNDDIYLNDILYHKVSADSFKVTNWEDSFVGEIMDDDGRGTGLYSPDIPAVLSVIEQLKNSEIYCLLQTDLAEMPSLGDKVAVYKIGEKYYFLSFNDFHYTYEEGRIMRIFCAEGSTDGENIPIVNSPVINEGIIEFEAKAMDMLSQKSLSRQIKVDNGIIYTGDSLQMKKYQKVSCTDFDMTDWEKYYTGTTKSVVMDKVKKSKLICLLETEADSLENEQIAVYYIEGAYCFFCFSNEELNAYIAEDLPKGLI